MCSIEDQGRTDRVKVDLDLQSQQSYGHDRYACKRSRSKIKSNQIKFY